MLDDKRLPVIGNTPTPRSLLQILWRRLWAVVLVMLVLTGSGVVFSLMQPSTYVATVRVLIGQDSTDAPVNLAGDVQGLQSLMPTMVEAVTTAPVAQAATERLDLPKGRPGVQLGNVSAQLDPEGTMFIAISYSDVDPKRAQQIANALGNAFTTQVSEVSPRMNAVTATVWEPATLPLAPVSPNPVRNGMLALMVGTLLGVGLAFLLESLDDSWRSPEEVERISGVPTVASIPRIRNVSRREERRLTGG
jgi:capsular polysaccharide biosynthesis protein